MQNYKDTHGVPLYLLSYLIFDEQTLLPNILSHLHNKVKPIRENWLGCLSADEAEKKGGCHWIADKIFCTGNGFGRN